MLKKLRRKFIIINMSFIGLVLIFVFVGVCITSYKKIRLDMRRSLERGLSIGKEENHKPPKIGGSHTDFPSPNSGFLWVKMNDDGIILETKEQNAYMTEDTLNAATQQAFLSSDREGILHDLNLYYVKVPTMDGVNMAFTDSGYLFRSMKNLVVSGLFIGIFILSAFLFMSLFLSRWALRPVEKAWQQQHQFVADASHELKTPLTVILANLSILQKHTSDTIGQQRKWVDSTEEEASHMRNLIEDLLFLAKSDGMDAPIIHSSLDLSELVYSNILQFEPIAFEKNIILDSSMEDNLIIMGDFTQLKQLISILLDNACKYAGENGKVLITLLRQQNNIHLSVNNSGPFIPKEDLPYIFQRFYRSDKARTQEGGYGLGLSIAKSIVDNHKGTIFAESKESQGTTFHVRFPTSFKY